MGSPVHLVQAPDGRFPRSPGILPGRGMGLHLAGPVHPPHEKVEDVPVPDLGDMEEALDRHLCTVEDDVPVLPGCRDEDPQALPQALGGDNGELEDVLP